MQTTLGGTLFVYQGEEIGMRNAPTTWRIEEFKNIETINYWKKNQKLYANDRGQLDHARAVVDMKARDHARTPMQWTATDNAGFCDPACSLGCARWTTSRPSTWRHRRRQTTPNDLSVWQFWQ
ncbi:hypothetical protein DL771_002331 [Monosporascus sp. 5C6A]|nr:hypothetical protein DL771_002331 [Monosporascus sp. 5C6A]